MNKNYIFHIIWKDKNNKPYKIGILAQIEEYFYLVTGTEKTRKKAYANGYIGLTGFRPGEVYRSMEMFEFFKNRVETDINYCEELEKNNGISMIDSVLLEKVPEESKQKYMEDIIEAYRMQCKNKEKLQRNTKYIG